MKTMKLGVCSTFFLEHIHGGAAGVECVWQRKFGVELFFLSGATWNPNDIHVNDSIFDIFSGGVSVIGHPRPSLSRLRSEAEQKAKRRGESTRTLLIESRNPRQRAPSPSGLTRSIRSKMVSLFLPSSWQGPVRHKFSGILFSFSRDLQWAGLVIAPFTLFSHLIRTSGACSVRMLRVFWFY
jgi:hypothetical protein